MNSKRRIKLPPYTIISLMGESFGIKRVINSYAMQLEAYPDLFLLVSKRVYASIKNQCPDVLHRVKIMQPC